MDRIKSIEAHLANIKNQLHVKEFITIPNTEKNLSNLESNFSCVDETISEIANIKGTISQIDFLSAQLDKAKEFRAIIKSADPNHSGVYSPGDVDKAINLLSQKNADQDLKNKSYFASVDMNQ